MLTELFAALTALLTPLDAPLYLADAVPQQARFPYLTAELDLPAPGQEGRVTLTCWTTAASGHEERLHWGDALLTGIPASGLRADLTGSVAVIRRSGHAGVQCVRSGAAMGLALPLDLHLLPRA